MTTTNDLLIEIGTEELPPKALKKLSQAFTASLVEQLGAASIEHGDVEPYAAPRRLAVLIKATPESQPDQLVKRSGPAVQAAFDADGNPTKAAEGFARSCGITVAEAGRIQDGKVEKLYYELNKPGASLSALIPAMVEKALADLPIPKRMRWGNNDYQFVRPVQWILMLHGSAVIDAEIMGLKAGNVTRGHRFHAPADIAIANAADYAHDLKTAYVEASFEARQAKIKTDVEAKAEELGGVAVIDPDLLDEVTGLVEWPVVIAGNFEERFLDVPKEALIKTMQDNQKYFAILDGEGNIKPHFITISNIESKDPQQVSEGNERVIRPRFADAEFFWNQDRKHKLEDNNEALKKIVFQNKLGTVYEKANRISTLAGFIAEKLGSNAEHAQRAGILSKADLSSEMVLEFGSMQGIAGRYYAAHDGEPADVPVAIQEQYKPLFAGDTLPETATGQAVSLADKLDTLMGIWAAGQQPTGAKDPFALRRAALGVLRIIIEGGLALDLRELLEQAASAYADEIGASEKVQEVYDFAMDRLRPYFVDQGYTPQQFDAVLAVSPASPLDFSKRISAVKKFSTMKQADSLSAANKRIRNILKKVEGAVSETVNRKLFQEDQETSLFGAIATQKMATAPMLEAGEYDKVLANLAMLKDTVDAFFDGVMVMAEDEALKNNRIALLAQLRAMFLQVADLSQLQN